MRIGAIVLVVWLVIGLAATLQRGYLTDRKTNCAEVTTVLVTVVAGPLNYVGVNPKVNDCKVPEPSK